MEEHPPRIASLDHLVLTVADLAASIAFYTRVLGCTEVTFGAGRKALRFGDQKINLHAVGRAGLVARVPTAGSADLCFLSATPVEDWCRHLRAQGVAIEAEPSERAGATGPIRSVYVRDPDGNLIEISNRL